MKILALALLALLSSCSSNKSTLIVVEVFTEDLAPTTDFDAIRIRVLSPGATQFKLDVRHKIGPGHGTLPFRVAIFPEGPSDATVEVVAEALSNDKPLVSQSAILPFARDEHVLVKMVLSRVCASVSCSSADLTCFRGTCRSKSEVAVEPFRPGKAPVPPGHTQPDASAHDAPMTVPETDADVVDATPIDPQPPGSAPDGTKCTSAEACASGACQMGVCCNKPCDGLCVSCRGEDTGGLDGTCGPVLGGRDPQNQCSDEAATKACGQDGQCDGAGACRLRDATASCGSASCVGGEFIPERHCTGQGSCQNPTPQNCAGYACVAATGCMTSCQSPADCQGNKPCVDRVCDGKRANGAACANANECGSGHCVDNVCCGGTCEGACLACVKAKTGATDGVCAPIKLGEDPDAECPSSVPGPAGCGSDGSCNGAGACRLHPIGTPCVGEECVGATYTTARVCDAAGQCQAGQATPCTSFKCGIDNRCLSRCNSDSDCASPGDYCSAGNCYPKKPLGGDCARNEECGNGRCVDSVCCESDCQGLCLGCKVAGHPRGMCRPLPSDTPETACTPAPPCGNDGKCNGLGGCQKVLATTPCAPAMCQSGSTYTPNRKCDGAGNCAAAMPSACPGNRVCQDANSCKLRCASNADCTGGLACYVPSGECKLALGTPCTQSIQCASNVCVDGVCCNTTCDGTCRSCNLPNNAGTCLDVPAGQDPNNECVMACTGQNACQGSGTLGAPCQASTLPCTPNSGMVCNGVICVCGSDTANCDGVPSNGCEVLISDDTRNCGGCNIVCPANAICCRNGSCLYNSNACD